MQPPTLSTIRKKPWNRLDLPVYSIASCDGSSHNMNIGTYASQVSMHPKRYMVAIYKGTKTLANVEQQRHMVLQILSTEHLSLVTRFGKQSGLKKNKLRGLDKRLMTYDRHLILTDALAAISLSVRSMTDAGDHIMMLCDVLSYTNISAGEPLMLNHLRERKLISI